MSVVEKILGAPGGTGNAWLDFVHDFSGKSDGTWYFRGQDDRAWDLIPNIARADVCGPLGYSLAEEQVLFEKFKDEAVQFHAQEFEQIEWLAIAQHHGLPTRLLDWSTNPLVAAWFACRSENSTCNAAVHMIRHAKSQVERDRKFDPYSRHLTDMVLVSVPPRAARITAQQGLFTSHSSPDQAWTFISGQTRGVVDYQKVVIPAVDRSFFRMILNVLGVNQSRMMRDLQGLCETLKYEYRNRT